MALKKGDWWHASAAADLDQYLLRHVLGRHCRGVPHRVTHARGAGCGAGAFDLFIADGERILRVCTACQAERKVCDLDGKCDAGSAGEIVCTCMYSECEVAVGFALLDPPQGGAEEDGPVGHLYVAGRCTECGVYSEWSPEGDYSFPQMAQSVCAPDSKGMPNQLVCCQWEASRRPPADRRPGPGADGVKCRTGRGEQEAGGSLCFHTLP